MFSWIRPRRRAKPPPRKVPRAPARQPSAAASGPAVPAQLAHGISVFGLFIWATGLGESARRSLAALRAAGVPVTSHLIHLAGAESEIAFPTDDPAEPAFDTALIHINANQTPKIALPLKGRRRIGYWHWELPVFPARWARALNFVDEIWVPSRFIEGLVTAATNLPVRLVPHPAIVAPVDRAVARAALGLPESRRIILSVFDFRSYVARKNPEAIIRAFRDAFAGVADPPLLLVKCQYAGTNPKDMATVALMQATPDVMIIDRLMTPDEIRQLYAAADAFVSLHRSEGFGLNLIDCMALGKPVMATGFSGNLDFMTAENSILVPYAMRAVQPGEYVYGHGQWWAEPDHDASVAGMRWLGQAADSALAALGERARVDTNRDFSLERVGEISRRAWEGGAAPPPIA